MEMKKQCKRKHWARLNPIEHAMFQASKLTTAEWNEQMAPVITATEQLAQGNWDPLEDWNPLFFALNRIESMLHIKRVDDQGFIAEAQAAFVSALDRQQKTGVRAFKAEELATIREVASVYGDLLSEITHKDFKAACAHTDANVKRILRQRGPNTITKAGCVIERVPA
jgi:hypothetical protein